MKMKMVLGEGETDTENHPLDQKDNSQHTQLFVLVTAKGTNQNFCFHFIFTNS